MIPLKEIQACIPKGLGERSDLEDPMRRKLRSNSSRAMSQAPYFMMQNLGRWPSVKLEVFQNRYDRRILHIFWANVVFSKKKNVCNYSAFKFFYRTVIKKKIQEFCSKTRNV